MAKYRVWARSIDYVYIDVEAEDEAKAKEMAEVIDGGEFHTDNSCGDWEWGSIAELDNDVEVDYKEDEFYGEEV